MHRHALSVLSSVLSLGLGEGFMSLDHPGQEHRKPCVAETCSIVGGGGVGWGIHLRKKKKKIGAQRDIQNKDIFSGSSTGS